MIFAGRSELQIIAWTSLMQPFLYPEWLIDEFQEGELNLEVVYVAPDQDSDDDGDVMIETQNGFL